MEIVHTSTLGTHRGKRLSRLLVLTATVGVVVSCSVLGSVTKQPSNATFTASDGTKVALMTAPPQDGTVAQREAWRASVLADPNVLGHDAPRVASQSYDSRTYFPLANDSQADGAESGDLAEPQATGSPKPTQEAAEATPSAGTDSGTTQLTDEQRAAVEKAKGVVTPVAQQAATPYMTYSGDGEAEQWVKSISSSVSKAGGSISPDLSASLTAGSKQGWEDIRRKKVKSTAQLYSARKPSVWVAPDLSAARVVLAVQRTVSMDGMAKRLVYPLVTVDLTAGKDDAWVVTSIHSQ